MTNRNILNDYRYYTGSGDWHLNRLREKYGVNSFH